MSSYGSLRQLPSLLRPRLLRRTAFISYFHGDRHWAQDFVSRFGGTNGVFIPRVLGLDDDKINSFEAGLRN